MATAELLDSVVGPLEDEIYKALEYNPPPELPKKNLRSAAHNITLGFLDSLPRLREVSANGHGGGLRRRPGG